ncbi:MAG: S9 family peptidase [Ardenticatenaceae bacterium]|nr:S9 family peptidase [Anaerolineales bacterium]MCB8940774.1 S9 family peptidase [Ardenticatenaceae bacterium]MCB8972113.1 S9 family peptidase [Ardenticatenaceae bacterium]
MDSHNFKYPTAHKVDVVDNYHGTAVPDPYRWLENPNDPDAIAWMEAQNELTQSIMAELPVHQQFNQRLTALWNYPKSSVPRHKGDNYFVHKNDGLQNQPILYKQASLDAPLEQVIDPNTLSEDGTIALMNQSYSKDGRFLAYTLSQSGSDWQTIHIRDLESNEDRPEVLRWAKFTNAAWLPDGSGFFYARYPSPDEMPDAPPSTHQQIFFHKLGTPQSADQIVFARPDAPNLGFNPHVTKDGRYLTLHVWDGTDRRNRFYYRSLDSEEFIYLLDDMDASYNFLGNDGPKFYFQTDNGADNGRLIAIHLNNPDPANWQTIIPAGEDALAFSLMVNNQFVLGTLHHGQHKLHRYALDGTHLGEIELPVPGTIFDLSGERDHTELFIQFQSFTYPPTILRYDFATDALTILDQPQLDFDPDAYETTQVFYPSKDGTKVPLFITHKKGIALDGENPTLLYGYGGFNISMTPIFSPTRLAWLERGGVYAQACLRGGTEYGEAWHQAGMLANKQNVFDDFIAAGEWLIATGYTNNKKLAIEGRSNGGLLVAACMVQRPDLFGAVHCGVPVIDMLRYHKFSAGRYWIPEYGNAEANPEHFKFMMAYSPLHNVQPDHTYPPLLITTADTDDRVVPMHSKKFAATLQAADNGRNPLLIRIETRAGHGLGKPTAKLIEEATDVYSFLWTMLNK